VALSHARFRSASWLGEASRREGRREGRRGRTAQGPLLSGTGGGGWRVLTADSASSRNRKVASRPSRTSPMARAKTGSASASRVSLRELSPPTPSGSPSSGTPIASRSAVRSCLRWIPRAMTLTSKSQISRVANKIPENRMPEETGGRQSPAGRLVPVTLREGADAALTPQTPTPSLIDATTASLEVAFTSINKPSSR